MIIDMATPRERSENEETINRRSALALTIVIALAVGGLSTLLGDSGEKKQAHEHLESAKHNAPDTNRDLKTTDQRESENVLKERLDEIAGKLSKETSNAIRSELDSIAAITEDESWNLKEESTIPTTIKDRLNAIEQQVDALIALSEPSDVETDLVQLESVIDDSAKRNDEKTANDVDVAVKAIQTAWQPRLRKVELELRDKKDIAAKLREDLARTQREQISKREKANRAAALNRDMAEVRKYLPAFTTPGHYQPNSTSSAWVVELTIEARPVSLSRLDKLGALKQTVEGLDRLYAFGGGRAIDVNNDRPQGSFPNYAPYYIKQLEIRSIVARSQELLREHGQAMVEAGILSP